MSEERLEKLVENIIAHTKALICEFVTCDDTDADLAAKMMIAGLFMHDVQEMKESQKVTAVHIMNKFTEKIDE